MVRPALASVRRLARQGELFQLLWADPPFDVWQDGLAALSEAVRLGILEEGGTACLECPSQAVLDELPASLELERDLGGGASRVVLLRCRLLDGA